MFVSVIVRKLKPGKTYEDFISAWYPDKGFGVPVRGPVLCRSISDPDEILALAFLDIADRATLDEVGARIAAQEAVRHDRIAEVIAESTFRGIFEVGDEFDFSTDATVAAGRPTPARG